VLPELLVPLIEPDPAALPLREPEALPLVPALLLAGLVLLPKLVLSVELVLAVLLGVEIEAWV
jgi:hypothetical protein